MTDAEYATLLDLADHGANDWHEGATPVFLTPPCENDGHRYLDNADGGFDTCPHPECALIRRARAEASHRRPWFSRFLKQLARL